MTTTQIKFSKAAHVFGATVSVVTGTPAFNDSAGGIRPDDLGATVTTTSTAGRRIQSVTSPTAAVMDGNASASTGPQVATLTPALINVTKKSVTSCVDKTTQPLTVLPTGQSALAQHAINQWVNCGGVAGTIATRATKILAAQGISIQET